VTFRGGVEKLIGCFFVQVIKASGGKANPKVINDVLKTKL
jgi:aspartyl-tRNA(Asn)/glutamyl-tRNA(Gln) amidotransferase subunit B